MAEQIDVKQSNKALIITGILIGILVIGLITNGFGIVGHIINGGGNSEQNISLSRGESPSLGNPNAPVKIYVFSDFSCPYCAEFATNTLLKIEEEYASTGKAEIIFKYLKTHGTGQAAMDVGYALNEQGLFWEFHDLAFREQENVGNLDRMKELAEEVGANMTQLEEFLESNKANYLSQQDINSAVSNNIRATPTAVVNNQILLGPSYEEFKSAIDKQI